MLTDAQRAADFPTLSGMTYLNTAAEGISPRCVAEALATYAQHKALGMAGRDPHFQQLETLKATVGRMYGLSAEEVAVCSCSSEAYNLAAMALRLQPGDEVIINDLDFPAGATPWLQPTHAASVRLWEARDWALRLDDLVKLLTPRTRIVTVSAVSFFNGYRVPIQPLIETVRKHSSSLVAVDVTQALGRIPLDLRGVDLIVSSTHKWILGSHGGGLVGVPRGSAERLHVPAGGWYNLADAFGPDRFQAAPTKPGAPGFAVGMPNFPAIYAVSAALAYIEKVGPERIDQHARPLVHACREGLSRLPVELITPGDDETLAGILAFRHPDAAQIHRRLLDENIHIMEHAGRLRVAIHGYNTADDVERFLATLTEALQHVAAS